MGEPARSAPRRDHALLYDRECGLCTFVVDVLLRWDRRARLRPVALQDPEADALLSGMEPARRMESFHLVAPDGTPTSGGPALPPLLDLLPAGAPLSRLLAAAPALTDRGYRWIAKHRATVSRPVPRRLKARARRRVSRFRAEP